MIRSLVKNPRRHPRVGLARPTKLRLEGARGALPAQIVDLSEGGLRGVAALPDLAPGTNVTIELRIPAWIGQRTLSLPAQLVRLGAPAPGGRHREFAVEFRPPPAAVAARLAAFVRRALAAQAKLATIQGQDSPLADALRMVRVSLGPPKPDRARAVLVTSAVPGEGKSFTAGHLAALLASEGQRVLLVDGDLRKPSLAGIFGVAPAPGLAEWLAQGGDGPVAAFAQPTPCGVRLLAAGRGASLSEGWTREDALAVVERLRAGEWDFVVIDSAPLLVAAISSLLAAAADDVLLVARAGATREQDLLEARRLLERHGANLRGVVLNDHDDARPAQYRDYGRTPKRSLRRLVRRTAAEDEATIYELVSTK